MGTTETTPKYREEVVELLGRFPEVEWDRMGRWGDQLRIFGWVARPDDDRDFVVLEIQLLRTGIAPGVITSSAKYSYDFYERVVGSEWARSNHVTCERVVDVFPEIAREGAGDDGR